MHFDRPTLQADLGDQGHVGVITLHQRNAPSTPCWQGTAPTGFLCGKFEHVRIARLLLQHAHAVGQRVFARSSRQLVDEALVGKRVQRVADRAPVTYAQARIVLDDVVLDRWNVVALNGRLGHQRVLHLSGQAKHPPGDRLRRHAKTHRRRLAIGTE